MEDERLAIRKIVVDSRTATAGTGSDFQVQLPETVTLPKHYGCYVTDIQCTHSWRTITETLAWKPKIITFTSSSG